MDLSVQSLDISVSITLEPVRNASSVLIQNQSLREVTGMEHSTLALQVILEYTKACEPLIQTQPLTLSAPVRT